MTLKGSRTKLRRAREHFNAIEREIAAFLKSNPFRVVVDRPTDELYVVRLDNAPEIPADDWAVLVGDCVHNMRCALDYIAWQLAGSDPDDNQTQFPIFETEDGWRRNGVRRVARMLPAARALIEQGQPYRATDPSHAALNGIRVLDDADKHKLLTVVAAMPVHVGITWATPVDPNIGPQPRINVIENPKLVGDAIIATLVIPNAPRDMKMEIELAPDISFGESLFGTRTHVLGSLTAGLVEVEAVIAAFEARPELFKPESQRESG